MGSGLIWIYGKIEFLIRGDFLKIIKVCTGWINILREMKNFDFPY